MFDCNTGAGKYIIQWPNANLLAADWPIDARTGAKTVYENRLVLEIPPLANLATCKQIMFADVRHTDIPTMCLSTRLLMETLSIHPKLCQIPTGATHV